jgi:hypothetical protein
LAVNTALRSTRVKPKVLAAGGFSMAGADWPENFVLLLLNLSLIYN